MKTVFSVIVNVIPRTLLRQQIINQVKKESKPWMKKHWGIGPIILMLGRECIPLPW